MAKVKAMPFAVMKVIKFKDELALFVRYKAFLVSFYLLIIVNFSNCHRICVEWPDGPTNETLFFSQLNNGKW